MSPKLATRLGGLFVGAAFLTLAAMACTTSDPGVSDNNFTGTGPGTGDPCQHPGVEGCPCVSSGATAECGKVTKKTGDYVSCQLGTATCDGAKWGSCQGNQVVTQSLPGTSLTTQGLSFQSITGACNDPCDPYCTQTQSDPSDVDASGLEPTDAGISIVGTVVIPDASAPACKGLQCNVTTCTTGSSTTLTGHVYDPAGVHPLYNAYVYIPVDPTVPLPAFSSGASCDTCAGSGSLNAVSVAQTDSSGAFTLTDVPDSVSFPLVVQVGKWRREVIVPAVTACATTAVDPANSRLPRNRTDGNAGKADMPHLAIASGNSDPFECLLAKIGIDPAEIDVPSKNPAIDYYVANGKDRFPGGAPPATALVSSVAALGAYDAVMLPCEGFEDDSNNAYVPNLTSYTDGGGRLFTTHFGYGWLATPNGGTAQNLSEYYGTASWNQPFQQGTFDTWDPMTAYVDTSFPKGTAYAQWLQNVGASSLFAQLTVAQGRHDIRATMSGSQRWVYGWSSTADPTASGTGAAGTEDMAMNMTFNTPVGAATQCGRVVFSDFHVSTSDITGSSGKCTSNAQCGYGSTCNPPVLGTCDQEPCTTTADCGDGNLACAGQTPGSCGVRACTTGSDCNSNVCSGGLCQCTASSQCGAGNTCTAGVCSGGAACYSSNSDCGLVRKCNGISPGACTKSCTTSADCGAGDACIGGACYTACSKSSQCPGSTTACNGAVPATCSATSDSFPYSCVQTPMSAQEEALEFMFFDLAACVSSDKYAPPPPPPPVTYYYPATFTQQLTATCPSGQLAKWREVDWQATIPSSASIDFSAQTGADFASLGPSTPVAIAHATTTTPAPLFDVAYIDLSDKGGGGAFATHVPPITSQPALLLTIAMNPTSDQLATPSLGTWKVRYDCVDAQ